MLQSEKKYKNAFHELAIGGEGGQLSAALLIENEIERYETDWRSNRSSAILKFCPEVERRFEIDTCGSRARELQLTMALGVGFFFATTITDFVFVPDLGLLGLLVRAAVVPIVLMAIFCAPRLPGHLLEWCVTCTGIVVITVMTTIPAVSSAPLSTFGFATAMLGLIYGNTTLPLRFKGAWVTSVVCGVIMILEIFAHAGISSELQWMLGFQVVMASTFSLITSYRIEKSTRLKYLFSSREGLRLKVLSADREKLTTLSNTDALTGLVNRRHFDRESAAIFSSPSNAGKDVALVFIDVDHFKRYNDHYGHPAGDSCLRAVASAVSGALRGASNLTARYGGEEFAILLVNESQAQAEIIAQRVCTAVSGMELEHVNRRDGAKFVTISVGVSCGVIGYPLTIESLIESADEALYAAKRGGRNRVESFFFEAA
ncbi:MAG: GGDEF domain-containing protein [Bradyrhizobium sp.]|jgi:diguanylate cyclase (GGDEF)-like protein